MSLRSCPEVTNRVFDPVAVRLLLAVFWLAAVGIQNHTPSPQRASIPVTARVQQGDQKARKQGQIALLGCLDPASWNVADVLGVPGIQRAVARRLVAHCRSRPCKDGGDLSAVSGVSTRLARRVVRMSCWRARHLALGESK